MRKLKLLSLFLTVILVLQILSPNISAEEDSIYEPNLSLNTQFDCKSAILMEATTGKVLFEQNADIPLPPASVTKIMTLLLVMEAINQERIKLTDMVTASANACSMGGSQIYLKEGEEMSVEDLIKSVVIASANDAAVALAEHVEGSEEAFVKKMNDKAEALGMSQTSFENTNGLDDTATNHKTSARDIAIMSKELLKYDIITEYSSIWMDTIRNGAFGLTNTNRLIRFYKGATGLKTGSTSKAGFCISATAKRDNLSLICVVMAAPTRDIRNQIAKELLDWGFSNFSLYTDNGNVIDNIYISGGSEGLAKGYYNDFNCVLDTATAKNITKEINIFEDLSAPIKSNTKIGEVVYKTGEIIVGKSDIYAKDNTSKITLLKIFSKILSKIVFAS
jgi:D-alanyl-D-alanine carboxypeptidase (penicillin-binding protein 5/6)